MGDRLILSDHPRSRGALRRRLRSLTIRHEIREHPEEDILPGLGTRPRVLARPSGSACQLGRIADTYSAGGYRNRRFTIIRDAALFRLAGTDSEAEEIPTAERERHIPARQASRTARRVLAKRCSYDGRVDPASSLLPNIHSVPVGQRRSARRCSSAGLITNGNAERSCRCIRVVRTIYAC